MDTHVGVVCGHRQHGEFGDRRPVVVETQAAQGDILGMVEHRFDHFAMHVKVGLVPRHAETAGILEIQRHRLGRVRIVVGV